MPKTLQLPFQAYHNLRKWYDAKYRKDLSAGAHPNRQLSTYYDGMKHWFHNQPASIRICSYGGNEHYADVQYELYIGKSSIQVYLMTVITPEAVAFHYEVAEAFGVDDTTMGVPIQDLTDPFCRPTVLWEVEKLTHHEIIKAVETWSHHFWPDFNCEYRCEMITDGIPDELLVGNFMGGEEFLSVGSDSHCRVLLQCDPSMLPHFEEWALSKGCETIYVSQSYLVLLDGCPRNVLPEIEKKFPSIDFVVASSL